MAADTGDLVPFGQQLLNREVLAQLGPSRNRPVDQDLVEDAPPWCISIRDPVDGWRSAFQGEWTNVELQAGNRWTVRGHDLVQQPPLLESGDARLVDVVGRERVARKAGLVQQQDFVAFAGQQHGRR